MSALALPWLGLVFAGAAAMVWFAGVRLSNATDTLVTRFHLGEALGGLLLLAVATNLPEIAIVASATLEGRPDVAAGNILGGIAIQTLVLVLLDAASSRRVPLTARGDTLVPALEAALVMTVLVVTVMATQLPATASLGRIEPGAVAVAIAWALGIRVCAKAKGGLPWRLTTDAGAVGVAGPVADQEPKDDKAAAAPSTARAGLLFAAAALATLAGGVLLERSGDAISARIGLSGALFAATVLAAATAIPEISTGLQALKLGDEELAVSDIFGGNAFLPVLFLEAGLIAGHAVLPRAARTDIYLAGLGALLSAVYLIGLVFRSPRQLLRMGLDSVAVVLLYLIGLIGLVAITHS